MKHEDLIAIDIHTHAEVSCWNLFDAYGEEARPRGRQGFRPAVGRPSRRRWRTTANARSASSCSPWMPRPTRAAVASPTRKTAAAAKENSDMMIAFGT